MEPEIWQPIVLALAVPTLTLLTAIASKDRDPAIYRRLRHSSAALKEAPEGTTARSELDALVAAQAVKLRRRESARPRRIKWMDLALAIIAFCVLAAVVWGMIAWTLSAWGGPWAWVALPATVVVGAVGVFMTTVFFSDIVAPAEELESHAASSAVTGSTAPGKEVSRTGE
ncbi:hypothetical protein [Agromyces sp. SYSU T0242]|uniref:hypothetical protein n=1 Tax=Agromyces litoreus TaxID=3158561 RepID=UPI00339773B1